MTDSAVSWPIQRWVESPAPRHDDRPLLVLMHGFGSNERDLPSLAAGLSSGLDWVSLRGPLDIEGGGAAWFPGAAMNGAGRDAIEPASASVLAWLDAHTAGRQVIPLGFSQGGFMVTELLRHAPDRFPAGIILSGFIVDPELPGDDALAQRRPPVFFGRGDADQRVTPEMFQQTETWLTAHTTATIKVYPGLGHAIAPQEVADIDEFLTRLG